MCRINIFWTLSKYFLLFGCFCLYQTGISAKTISVYYPYKDSSKDWASDLITQKLLCPSITELNLSTRKSNSVAIKSIQAVKTEGFTKWIIRLRSDLYFWSEDKPVSGSQMASFFNDNLKNIIKEKNFLLEVPSYSVREVSSEVVEIIWSKVVDFGPFILNNVPIRKDNECASFVKPEVKQDSSFGKYLEVSLRTKKDSKSKSKNVIRFYSQKPNNIDIDNLLEFKFAGAYKTDPKTRLSDEPIRCKSTVELPLFSSIFWNSYDKNISKEFREAITLILPRGELLRSGAGSMGSVLSFPILKDHPGYNSGVKLKPYSLDQGLKMLEGIGFKRNSSDRWKELEGKKFKINLLYKDLSDILKKSMKDIFNFVGVDSSFEKYQSQDPKKYSGYISTFYTDEDYDYLNYFHSNSKSKVFSIINNKDKNLDDLLYSYSLSLTRERADFSFLSAIHKYIADQELVSTIIQSNACLEYSTKGSDTRIKLPSKLKLNSKLFLSMLE